MAKARAGTAAFSKQLLGLRASGGAAAAAMGTMMRFIAPLGAIGGFIGTVRSIEMFNRAMNQSLAIMGDVSDVMRERLAQAAIEVSRTTVFSAEEAARAYFFLASAGLNAEQSIAALPLVAKFAQAGMFDLARATDLVTDAQSALGLTVDDARANLQNMTRVADVLVKANTLANASVEQFSQALTTKAGAALKILGKDIEEGVAVLAAFADQGVKAGDAGTALNIVLRDLSTKALRNASAFKQHGVAVFDSAGEMRNIGAIIADLEGALAGMSDAQAKATLLQLGFTDKSVIFIQTLLGMSDRIKEYEADLRKAGDTTADVAANQMTPFQEATARLSTAWLQLGRDMETGAIPKLINALAVVIEFIDKLNVFRGVAESVMVVWQFFGLVMQGVVTGVASALEFLTGLQAKVFGGLPLIGEALRNLAEEAKLFAEGGIQAMEDRAAELEERWAGLADIWEFGDDTATNLQATVNDLTSALLDTSDATEQMAEKMSEAQQEADKLIAKLQEQVDTFGMSALEADLFRIGIENLTDAQREQIEALQEQLKALEEQKDLQREAERVIEQTRTPLEKYEQEIEKLEKLLEEGLIDQETFERAVKAAGEALDQQQQRLEPKEMAEPKIGEFEQVRLNRLAIGGIGGMARKPASEDTLGKLFEIAKKQLEEQQRDKPVRLMWN
jgi:TP901 family phage tail tape measure protein